MRALLTVLLVPLLLPTAAADWLQAGGDAAHLNVADGEGPSWKDVAFRVDLVS